ncbi:hypothetical protein K503DRAFT_868862 [Rhizopogon vinicolor AM-OR11-026]|uniref:Uncharacterized protein n=1 Tax=Rhizopogon vinicolor AM-OR11-026 TaxID=1314800 RepID=A0A1B7MPI8_9AGAM|nr:hypothetical protein K503DRAFT_868862 [Rhizopogon vinicolor AM-OR11-026]
MLNLQPASIPFQYPPFPPIILPSVTSAPASDNNFSFAHQQPTRCHGQQHASTAQNRLSLDHTLSRFKGELQKSRDKGAKLISLSMSKNDIRGTFGAPAVHPPSFLYALFSQPQDFLHFPQSFPYFRVDPPQPGLLPSQAAEPCGSSYTSSIYTITPHELEGIIKEDENDEDHQSAGTREKQGMSMIPEPMEMGT